MIEVRAKLRSAKVASQKARLVADQIRGKQVEQALDILTHDLHKSSHIVKKVLESAIANAQHNNGLDIDNLFEPYSFTDCSYWVKNDVEKGFEKGFETNTWLRCEFYRLRDMN